MTRSERGSKSMPSARWLIGRWRTIRRRLCSLMKGLMPWRIKSSIASTAWLRSFRGTGYGLNSKSQMIFSFRDRYRAVYSFISMIKSQSFSRRRQNDDHLTKTSRSIDWASRRWSRLADQRVLSQNFAQNAVIVVPLLTINSKKCRTNHNSSSTSNKVLAAVNISCSWRKFRAILHQQAQQMIPNHPMMTEQLASSLKTLSQQH